MRRSSVTAATSIAGGVPKVRNYAQVHLFIFTHGFKKKNGGKMRGRGALKAHTNALQTFQECMRGGQRIQGFAGLTSCCGRITRVRRCIRYAFCLQNADLMSWDRVEYATSPSRGSMPSFGDVNGVKNAGRRTRIPNFYGFFFSRRPRARTGLNREKRVGDWGRGLFFCFVLFLLVFFCLPQPSNQECHTVVGGCGNSCDRVCALS